MNKRFSLFHPIPDLQETPGYSTSIQCCARVFIRTKAEYDEDENEGG